MTWSGLGRGFFSTLPEFCQAFEKVAVAQDRNSLPAPTPALHFKFSSSYPSFYYLPFISWIPLCESLQLSKALFLHL